MEQTAIAPDTPSRSRLSSPDCSPRSRRGRQLRKLLRLHDEDNALIWAGRQISGIGPLIEERKRIEEELEAVAKEARTLDASGPASAALRAAALLAVKLGAFYEHKEAPAVMQAAAQGRRRGLGSSTRARRGRLSGRPFYLRRLRPSFSFAPHGGLDPASAELRLSLRKSSAPGPSPWASLLPT